MVMVKAIDDVHFLALKKFINFNEKPFSETLYNKKNKLYKVLLHVFNKNLV